MKSHEPSLRSQSFTQNGLLESIKKCRLIGDTLSRNNCIRLTQSLSHFAMTCNINGQIALKSLTKKIINNQQYPNQIFAGTSSQFQQLQQQQQQQAYQNQQRAAFQTLVAGGTGMPRTGNY